jgi:hypothetical protein
MNGWKINKRMFIRTIFGILRKEKTNVCLYFCMISMQSMYRYDKMNEWMFIHDYLLENLLVRWVYSE